MTAHRGGSFSMPAVSSRASASRTRMPAIIALRRDLGERHQHEGAFEQARMRQRQLRLVEHQIVIGEKIDVDGARAPAALAARSRPSARSTACARASSACGVRLVSTAMHRLTKGGWSATPQGGVR